MSDQPRLRPRSKWREIVTALALFVGIPATFYLIYVRYPAPERPARPPSATTTTASPNSVTDPKLLNILTLTIRAAGYRCPQAEAATKVGSDHYGHVIRTYCGDLRYRVTWREIESGGPLVRPW